MHLNTNILSKNNKSIGQSAIEETKIVCSCRSTISYCSWWH